MRAAWFCPSCQKHHAPHCDTCPVPVVTLPGGIPAYPLPGSSGDVPFRWEPITSATGPCTHGPTPTVHGWVNGGVQ